MAAKVALTAEEFRENSQRSIALFNTEKLSTDSTHVLKSAYCNSVHFCRCNLHGACGGKVAGASAVRGMSAGCNLHGACGGKALWSHLLFPPPPRCNLHGACGGKVCTGATYQWRTDVAICTGRVEAKGYLKRAISERISCNLHGACGGKVQRQRLIRHQRRVAICTGRVEAKGRAMSRIFVPASLQSARGVWRQRCTRTCGGSWRRRCNLHGACGGKAATELECYEIKALQSARGVWRQSMRSIEDESGDALQSARGVWRQSLAFCDFSPAQSRLQSARGVWRQRSMFAPPAISS